MPYLRQANCHQVLRPKEMASVADDLMKATICAKTSPYHLDNCLSKPIGADHAEAHIPAGMGTLTASSNASFGVIGHWRSCQLYRSTDDMTHVEIIQQPLVEFILTTA